MIPNYNAYDYKKLKKKDKENLVKDLAKEGRNIKDYEAEIKTLWPPERILPQAHWRVK